MKLKKVLLVLPVEEAESRLLSGVRAGAMDWNSLELVGVAAKSAVRIVDDVEDAPVREAAVRGRGVQGRPERAGSGRRFLNNTHAEPARCGDQQAQRTGPGEWHAMLLTSVAA